MVEISPPLGAASLDDALEWLRARFDPDAARGLSIVYEFDLTGPGGGRCIARVEDGRLDAVQGSHEAPHLRVRLAAADFFAIFQGRANADMLFMEDRIAVTGDLSLALKLRRVFGRGGPAAPRPTPESARSHS